MAGIYQGDKPVFADPTHFYAYDDATSGAEFYRYSIDANGVNLIDGSTLKGIGGYGPFIVDGGLVFGGGGGIINPNTTPPSEIAVLPLVSGLMEIPGMVSFPTLLKQSPSTLASTVRP